MSWNPFARWLHGEETGDELPLRIDFTELVRMTPGEAAGGPHEAAYYGLNLNEALAAGQPGEARSLLRRMLEVAPREAVWRLIASNAYERLSEEAEAMAQLGVALALEPEHAAVHRLLARALLKRGEREAAEAVLERGWGHYQKLLSRQEREAKRAQYFSILER